MDKLDRTITGSIALVGLLCLHAALVLAKGILDIVAFVAKWAGLA